MALTLKHALLSAVAVVLVPSTLAAQAAGEMRSVNDGVYTVEQAEAGKAAYRRHCAECHASGFFRGEPFRLIWSGQPASGFFEVVSTRMPMNNPASLKPEEYAAILAYILQINTYPAGDTALPSTREELELILIEDPPAPGGG